MTRYRAVSKDAEPLDRDFDEREDAVAWAVELLSPDRPKVQLAHWVQGEWERIGVFNHERGSA